jgi:cytochrome c-type biogenesis protein CcmH/NrfF
MTFFNWHPEAGEKIVSRYVWIYPVVAMAITAVVLTVWWIRTRKQQASLFEDADIEMGEITRK